MTDDPMHAPMMVDMNFVEKEDGSVCAHFDDVPGTHLRGATVEHITRYLAKATQIIAHIVIDQTIAAREAGAFAQIGQLTSGDLNAHGITTQVVDARYVTHVEGIHFAVLVCEDEAAYKAAFQLVLKVALLWVNAVQAGLRAGGLTGEDVVLSMPIAQHVQTFKTHD